MNRRIQKVVLVFLLIFSMLSPLASVNNAHAVDDLSIKLDGNLLDWVLDSQNNVIYAADDTGKLNIISLATFEITNTINLGGNASDLKQVANELYVALPATKQIKTVDLSTNAITKTILTAFIPQKIAIGNGHLFYVEEDQFTDLYDYDLASNTEAEVTIVGESYSSFYEPDLNLDPTTNTLYIGEAGSSGSDLKAISTQDYSLKSELTYDEDYGINNNYRNIVHTGEDIFFAGRKFNQTNLADIHGTYLEDDGFDAKIVYADQNYVYSTQSIFDRETYLKVASISQNESFETDFILTHENTLYFFDSSDLTIHKRSLNISDTVNPGNLPINNKLQLGLPIDDWVYDANSGRFYAISTSKNQLFYINADTLEIEGQRFIGSLPSDIDLVNNKIYVSNFGGTNISVLDTAIDSPINTITTLQNPYKITTDGSNLYYGTEDQWSFIYHHDLTTDTEQKFVTPGTNEDTYYEPDLEYDSTNNVLYVGESSSSGSILYQLNSLDGARITQSTTDYSYPSREVILDGNSVFYAQHEISKADINVELNDFTEDILFVNAEYVISTNSIFDRTSHQKIYEFPRTVDEVFIDSSGRVFVYIKELNALYRFSSITELQEQLVHNLRIGFNPENKFQFDWDILTGDGYFINYKKDDETTFNKLNTNLIIGNSYLFNEEELKSMYGYTVSFGIKSSFVGKESPTMETLDYFFKIPVPTNLIGDMANEAYTLSWDKVDLMDGYNLYYVTADNPTPTLVNESGPIQTNTYTIPKSVYKQWYGETVTFAVASTVNNRESDLSEVVTQTFELPVPIVSNVSPTYQGLTVNWEWENIVSVEGYNLYYKTDTDTDFTLINTNELILTNSYVIPKDLVENWFGHTVSFVVTSVANNHESVKSNEVKYTLDSIVPTNPIATLDEDQFTVSWDSNPIVDGYNFYYISESQERILINEYGLITKNYFYYPTLLVKSIWDGDTKTFGITSVLNGKESEMSELVSYTFNFDEGTEIPQDGEEDQPTDDTPGTSDNNEDDTQQDNDQTDNNQTSDDSSELSEIGDTVNEADNQQGGTQENDEISEDEDDTILNNDGSDNTLGNFVVLTPSLEGNLATLSDDMFLGLQENDGIKLDLTWDTNETTDVFFTSSQISLLINNNASIEINKKSVNVQIPSSILSNYTGDTTITVTKLDSVENAIGDVYDFTIKQGSEIVSTFQEPVTLTFNVDPNKVTNPDLVKVFYWNEDEEIWELIGGTYENGVVTAETTHFSTYTVFEQKPTELADATINKKDTKNDNGKDANTSSPIGTFLFILLGILVVVIVFVLRKRKLV